MYLFFQPLMGLTLSWWCLYPSCVLPEDEETTHVVLANVVLSLQQNDHIIH